MKEELKTEVVEGTEVMLDVTSETLLKFRLNRRSKDSSMIGRRLFEHSNQRDREILAKNSDKVYTLIEEDGEQFLVKGYRIVNRLGYLLLK